MLQSPEIRKVLESAPLFCRVSSKVLVKCLSNAKLHTLSSGEVLLVPGQINDLVYIIISGRLSIQIKESDIESIALLGAGECVGEMSILGDGHVSAYAIAATDCRLLTIDHKVLWDLIDRSHVAAHNMLRVLTKRIRHADQMMAESLEQYHGFSSAAIVDELTGLHNRHWMHEKFDRCLQRGILNNKACCLMMLEVDQFDMFTDSYGKLGGDQALRNIAHIMLSLLRPGDQTGHYLGAQFAIFLPNTSLFGASIVAERLRSGISSSMVVLPSGDALPSINVSIGISQVSPCDTLINLFARAEEALQLAHKSGGNCIKECEVTMLMNGLRVP